MNTSALRINAVNAERLARDLKSAQTRNTILRGALQRARFADGDAEHVLTVGGSALVAPTLRIAQLLEEQGRVPALRFARNADGTIIGIELAVVTGGTVVEDPASDDATGGGA